MPKVLVGRLREVGGELVPFLDGRDAEHLLRTPEVTALVSEVSALSGVRDWVNARLRAANVKSGRTWRHSSFTVRKNRSTLPFDWGA